MSIDQRKAGVLLSYIGEAIKIVIGFIYTPIMLRLVGQSEYGLYQLVYSVVSYLSLLSLGFGSSYMRFYTMAKVGGNETEVARLNGMFLTIFSAISVICILCGIVMIYNINHIFGEGLNSAEYHTARILMTLLIGNLVLTFPNSVFNCIIIAHEKFVFQKLLILAQNICSPFLTLPLLVMGYGSVAMVSVTTCVTLIGFVINIYYCVYKLKIKFVFYGFKLSLLKEMWVFTFFIFLNQIIDQVNWSVDKFLLGRLSGTTAVAIYGIGSQINTYYLLFSTSISNVFIPRVNRMIAENNNNETLTKLFTKVGRIQMIMMGLILTGFIFVGQPFIIAWAGTEYTSSYLVTLILIIPVTVPLIQNIGIEIQRAKNMHKARSIVYLFIAIANVFISIPLIKLYGPVGAALGTAISLIVGNIIFMNWYYHNRIGLDMIYFWKRILEFLPAFIIPCIIGFWTAKVFRMDGLLNIVLYAFAYSIIYITSMWLFGMNEEEKMIIKKPIKRILHRG